MDSMNMLFWGVLVVVLFLVLRNKRRADRLARESHARDEALFQAMFPELQPWYHPQHMVTFAVARLAQPGPGRTWRWSQPAGFAGAAHADCTPDPKGERLRMVSAAGELLTECVFDTHPEGAVVRVGNGKLTVDVRDPANPRVRYWHPQREFKWSRKGWKFITPVTDEPFSSSDLTSSSSGETSGSTSSFAGRGGEFGGAGASGGWDDGGGTTRSAGTAAAVAATAATAAIATGVAIAAAERVGDGPDNASGTAY